MTPHSGIGPLVVRFTPLLAAVALLAVLVLLPLTHG
jgi:hypothetical protein